MNFQPSRDLIEPLYEAAFPKYKEYCLTVSSRGMAISLETICYVRWLCEATAAKRVADLGSGFSSYILRQYQADPLSRPDVEVVSVDDSEEWLGRTERWLKVNCLPADGLIGPDEWVASGDPFDVILYDYSGGEMREAFMEAAVKRLAPDGFLIFDDAQHLTHHLFMAHTARSYGLALFDIVEQTYDQVGRHAVLAHRIPS